ncbi:MAG: serine hydrolase [Alphaproteobacteria bacterium]|nr:serine hydrolase [Alphaproteobacteria bacterium]
MTNLMKAFPASPTDQVTLANWRTGPFNKWAFHHVREIVASADIPNDPGSVWALDEKPRDLTDLQIELDQTETVALQAVLEETVTDGFVVMYQGAVVYETYANELTPHAPHILMSVSKSMLGLLAGILADKGVLIVDNLASDYVPELEATAYKGATVRHLLDMRAGVAFDEDYDTTSGPIIEYRKSTNWNPPGPGETASDLRSFLQTLTDGDGPHEGRFHYVSPNTDLLAWIIERASGRRYADLMSELLWQPLGAERSAYITVDRLGAPRAAGGMCVTARDLARVGQLMVQNGRRGSNQIVPEAWVQDIATQGSRDAWEAGSFAPDFPEYPIRYRSKWYILEGEAPVIFAMGIHGQHLFVDQKNRIVIAKMSSQPRPLEPEREMLLMKTVKAIQDHLISG